MPLLDINPVIGGHVTTWYLMVKSLPKIVHVPKLPTFRSDTN
jgi:hypothetical protein